MKRTILKTTPVESGTRRPHTAAPERSPADQLFAAQEDLAKQFAASATRFGEVLNRTIELTEAGMTIGTRLLNSGSERLLATIAEKITPVVTAAVPPDSSQYAPPPEAAPSAPADQAGAVIGNGHPAFPGGEIYIPFSISNDTHDRAKRITVSIGTLRGEQTGHQLDSSRLNMNPAAKTILPLDFEKFVIEGSITSDTLPDVYGGWIEVSGDEQFRISLYIAVGEAPVTGKPEH